MPNPSPNTRRPLLGAMLLACALGVSGCVPRQAPDAPRPRDSLEFLLAMSLESLLSVTFATLPEHPRGAPHQPITTGEQQ